MRKSPSMEEDQPPNAEERHRKFLHVALANIERAKQPKIESPKRMVEKAFKSPSKPALVNIKRQFKKTTRNSPVLEEPGFKIMSIKEKGLK